MVWSEYGLDGSQPYITYVVYGFGRYQTPRTYVIEYGAKEVFMAYSFTYPETSGIWKRYFQRKPEGIERKFHVKWTIEWESSG